MQSLNEEAQASNEELQATNEELEAANEELQATNEELMSLNEELNVKSAELLALNEEYTHVYDAIEFPIMVFDDNLRLRVSTPPPAATSACAPRLATTRQPGTPARRTAVRKLPGRCSQQVEPRTLIVPIPGCYSWWLPG